MKNIPISFFCIISFGTATFVHLEILQHATDRCLFAAIVSY